MLTSAWLVALLVFALIPAPDAGARAGADHGGDANADVHGPGPGQVFGFAGIRQVDDIAPATAADYVAGVNGNMTRTTMHWQALEPTRDAYNATAFSRYQQLYDGLTAQGITPEFVLQFAPAWAREPGAAMACKGDGCHYPPADDMLGQWRQFVAYVSNRFPEAAIEVWNEPNFKGQWQSGVDPEGYAKLLAAADEAVESVNPQAPVYAGGLDTFDRTGLMPAATFLQRAYAASPSLEGHSDAINFHVYPTAADYNAGFGPGSDFAQTFDQIRAVRDRYDPAKRLLISELGMTTSGPGAVSDATQGRVILAATRKILTMDDTLGLLIYTLTDRSAATTPDPAERGFGAVRVSAELGGDRIDPKLVYCMLRSAARNLYVGCPPDTRIATAPEGNVVPAPSSVSFGSPDALPSFQCSLDGAAFTACSSPKQLGTLAVGPHTFRVRASTLLGGVDPDPALATWTVSDPGGHPLRATVDRGPKKLKAGGKLGRFDVGVRALGAPLPIAGAKVCLAHDRKLRIAGQRCRRLPPIAPGASVHAHFRVGIESSVKRRKVKLEFTATATAQRSLPDQVRAKVRVR